MGPRKQIVPLNGATSKGKTISVIGGTVPLPVISHTTEGIGSSSPQGAALSVQPPPQYEDQIL